MNRASLTVVVIVLLILAGESRPARAQFFPQAAASIGNIEGFTVTGKGSVAAKPNRLEIDLEVSASSELTADAIVKYRDAKKRLKEAFDALKLANVAVEERGLLVDQKGTQMNPYFFGGEPSRKAKVEVQLTRKLIVKCSDIRKLDEEAILQLVAKLLDVAQDAGGKVGGGGMNEMDYYYGRYNRPSGGLVRFILDDYDKLEEEAYGKAVADAEARARRLSRLSRVKLGSISAVRETLSPGHKETGQDDEAPHKRLESSRFQEIPVRVDLLVRFNVSPLPEAPNAKVGE